MKKLTQCFISKEGKEKTSIKNTLLIIAAALLCGCARNTAAADHLDDHSDSPVSDTAVDETKSENIPVYTVTADYLPLTMEDIDAIALIRILDIEGSDNYNDELEIYGGVYTYGNFEVIEVLEGDIENGAAYGYMLPGGTISWEQYVKGADPDTLEKQIKIAEDAEEQLPEQVTFSYTPSVLSPGQAYYAVLQKRNVHGERYLIYPRDTTFMKLDENTLTSEETLGYSNETETWTDVRKLWYPENLNDPRLQAPKE